MHGQFRLTLRVISVSLHAGHANRTRLWRLVFVVFRRGSTQVIRLAQHLTNNVFLAFHLALAL